MRYMIIIIAVYTTQKCGNGIAYGKGERFIYLDGNFQIAFKNMSRLRF